MQLLLDKTDLTHVLQQFFAEAHDCTPSDIGVKLTRSGKHIAEISLPAAQTLPVSNTSICASD